MKLATFEELVLLVIGSLDDQAYGVAIKETLREKMNKNPSIGALHSALYRLEGKGYVTSREGGATAERGGRRKKFYKITALGIRTLKEVHQLRMGLARDVPGLKLSLR
jgi:PadR family transcriptional regulator, regulatory protein PadR